MAEFTQTGDTVSISGGIVRVRAHVGAQPGFENAASIGCSDTGSCGAISISGGTIMFAENQLWHIGAGRRKLATAESVMITGGSIAAGENLIDPAPSNGVDRVYRVMINLGVADNLVTNLVIRRSSDSSVVAYGANDVWTDGTGKICLWLKEGDYLLDAGGKSYNAAVSGSGATVTIIEEPATPKLTISSIVIDGGKIMLSIDGGQVAATRSAKKAAASDGIIKVRVATGLPMTDGNSRSVEPTLTDNGDGTVTATFEVEKPESGAMFFKVEQSK